ncbi:acetyltransferase C18B11.09c 2 [Colletotrichum truncatum]|uniref:Acetyltransferase C18B11.09c 2 n=1 Tax=Colletotrichum truncatum TaxID=5467 RepID=A0ACC3Z3E9_COLTU|nr:acetyltransferase C18B11.09c 2 [Colletotrichum truncatum]XP_036585428.1 acetyltransferase C18B11.09c 2 [Colletotrichum truncatum]KAF6780683.1 acetyltransferase C18B11.09c 2 [Colletotrichum truncatum]KAF6795479.1 acetyltransferase C18B11.09c 2 [Colletotrichum truncatum]
MATTSKDTKIIELARDLQGTPWCEEYEKMISGMLYIPLHPKLLEGRHKARCIVHKYNTLDPSSKPYDELMNLQQDMMKGILGKVGKGTFIEPPFVPDYGCNVIVGENCFINFNCTILDTSLVIIGDRVQFGPNVSIYTAGHETSVLSRIKFVEFGTPIRIEDDAWVGGGTIILPGVTIGKGSTIGAGSIVTKDIPPYSVAVGAPAKVIKKLPTVEEEKADPKNPYRNMPDRE